MLKNGSFFYFQPVLLDHFNYKEGIKKFSESNKKDKNKRYYVRFMRFVNFKVTSKQ